MADENTVENKDVEEEVYEAESSASEKQNLKKDKKKKMSCGWASFFITFIITVIFGGVALAVLAPDEKTSFYNLYYIIFIAFLVVVLYCCLRVQINISSLVKFYYEFSISKQRVSDLKSSNKKISGICEAYKESFLNNEPYDKTRSNADLYFGSETYLQDMNKLPILSFFKIIPGTFIGFGILGTFIGFANGLSTINISDSQSLLNGVQELLDGLKSAFTTSIVGVLASVFLNFVMLHPLLNKLEKCSKNVCDFLDARFFVSEIDAMSVTGADNRLVPFPVTMGIVLEKLEQVASNINQMGAIVGDQVTQSVKATLDKTIEKIIREEINKLKEEMNSSIKLLQECETHLMNAPVHLKEAAEKMQAAAQQNDRLFRSQSQDAITELVKNIDSNLNDKFSNYSKAIEETCGEMQNIKNVLSLIPNDFGNIDKSIQTTSEKLISNQATLETTLSESAQAFTNATRINESLTKSYEEQTKSFTEMFEKFTDVLNTCKETDRETKELLEGFKEMDVQIAKIFEKINENTKTYGDIVGASLQNYFKGFSDATKDVSQKFADATLVLSEEVSKINKLSKD